VGFHGSHCAGIASAVTNNAIGVAGAGWGCTLVPLKVSDPSGGITDAAITGAFLYAIDNGIDILSMSFGAPGDPGVPEFFQALVDDATDAGILCVAAAGNDGAAVLSYPAACNDVLAIGATTSTNARATFSTYGAWVDLAAPGEQIYSTICQNYEIDLTSQLFFILFFGWDGVTPYMLSDGTSMACPLAAGVAGLVKSQAPGISPQDLAQLLRTPRTWWPTTSRSERDQRVRGGAGGAGADRRPGTALRASAMPASRSWISPRIRSARPVRALRWRKRTSWKWRSSTCRTPREHAAVQRALPPARTSSHGRHGRERQGGGQRDLPDSRGERVVRHDGEDGAAPLTAS
jgi:subtilisin family serine protease